ncbi:MAG: right-handed parallel beta-helix repeat-containing protein [Chlorobi bacterium]|nr:right-handed parallel beta-helix repeat-containing protein [Chlorobiota bacterium]
MTPDSNNDAAATSPAPGDWRDLELYNTHGELNGATIRFGGASSNPALHFNNSDGYVDVKVDSSAYDGLYVYNSSNLTIENSEFTGNARYGINTYSVDTLQILNSIIQGNGSHGVYLQYSNAKMRGNTIINNTGYGIDNHYVSTLNLGNNDVNDKGENTIKNNDNGNYQLYNNTPNEINAYFNDWGYNTAAEIDAHIYDDNEDASKGEVHFDPWWVATDKFLSLKVYLEGPFNGTDMDIALKDGGYVPIMQPYNPALPYYDNSNPVWLYTGTESVVNIPDNVVDWVVVQLRDADSPANASSATIIDTQAAFLLKDGSVVGLDGVSALQSVPASNVTNNLYVVIYHRNHLGIMSKNALVENGGVFSYDFTTGPDKVYGGINGYKEMLAGKWGMVAGDGDGSGIVGNTDETSVWKIDLGTSGYLGGDFDLNGFGQNTDETNYWKVNLNAGGQVPGKSTGGAYKSQVPR